MELFCVFIAGVGVWGKQLSKPRALKSVTATICLAVAESQLPVFQLPWIQAGSLPRRAVLCPFGLPACLPGESLSKDGGS